MRLLTALFLAFLIHLLSGCTSEAQNTNVRANLDNSLKLENKAEPPQSVEPVINANSQTKAVFAVFEENKLNLYSSNLDGTDKQLLISEDSEMRSGMFTAIKAKVSPAGNAIAARVMQSSGDMAVFVIDNSDGYKQTILDKTAEFDWAPDGKRLIYSAPSAAREWSVFVIDSNGENKRKIVDKAGDPHWSPDGKKILYAVLQPTRANLQQEGLVGRPLWRNGNEWRVLNLESGADELLSTPEDRIQGLVSWIKDDQILFSSGQNIIDVLYLSVINLQTKEKRQIKLIEGYYQVGEISTNSSTARTVISILPDPAGNDSLCNYYQLSSTWQLGEHFVANPSFQCENMTWNGDHEVFYTKGTGPKGRIDSGVTSKSGYYILMSVYKYNFKTKRDKLILKSDGQEIYRVQGVLTDRALVVSNQSNARSPHYKLEVRDLDGTYRATLFISEKEMSFIGWLQPKVEQ